METRRTRLGCLVRIGDIELSGSAKDLVLLMADKNAQFAIAGALGRPKALGIRPIEFEFRVHPGRDGGARKSGPEVLALERRRFHHAMLVLDFEGSGSDLQDAEALEAELDGRLHSHWGNAAKSIVITPEVDAWVWGSDRAVAAAIAWNEPTSIRTWLREQGFSFGPNDKPQRPKEALERLLLQLQIPRSSALYEDVCSKISLQKCKDEAFIRVRQQLLEWFPSSTTG